MPDITPYNGAHGAIAKPNPSTNHANIDEREIIIYFFNEWWAALDAHFAEWGKCDFGKHFNFFEFTYESLHNRSEAEIGPITYWAELTFIDTAQNLSAKLKNTQDPRVKAAAEKYFSGYEGASRQNPIAAMLSMPKKGWEFSGAKDLLYRGLKKYIFKAIYIKAYYSGRLHARSIDALITSEIRNKIPHVLNNNEISLVLPSKLAEQEKIKTDKAEKTAKKTIKSMVWWFMSMMAKHPNWAAETLFAALKDKFPEIPNFNPNPDFLSEEKFFLENIWFYKPLIDCCCRYQDEPHKVLEIYEDTVNKMRNLNWYRQYLINIELQSGILSVSDRLRSKTKKDPDFFRKLRSNNLRKAARLQNAEQELYGKSPLEIDAGENGAAAMSQTKSPAIRNIDPLLTQAQRIAAALEGVKVKDKKNRRAIVNALRSACPKYSKEMINAMADIVCGGKEITPRALAEIKTRFGIIEAGAMPRDLKIEIGGKRGRIVPGK